MRYLYSVGDWRVDPALNLLERNEQSVHIEPRAMDVLSYLVSRRGEVLSISELIEAVWENQVSDACVYRVINILRNVLEDDPHSPVYIQTIPKRGYVLSAENVGPELSIAESNNSNAIIRSQKESVVQNALATITKRAHAVGIVAATLVILLLGGAMHWGYSGWTASLVQREKGETLQQSFDPAFIAVLPFTDLSPDNNSSYLVNGIHSEILTQLSRFRALKVISRRAVLEYRNSFKSARQIGEELGVGSVIEGEVALHGDFIDVHVRLIDASKNEQIWAQSYRRVLEEGSIFALQSNLAFSAADALGAQIVPSEEALLRLRRTNNALAYEFYLKGKEYPASNVGGMLSPLAVLMYRRAVEEDPEFALAWAELSIAHSAQYWWGLDRSESRLRQSLDAALHAIELAPELPEAHLAMGWYYYRSSRDFARALVEFDIAERSMPGDSLLMAAHAFVYRRMGLWDQSLDTMAKAIGLDPRNDWYLSEQAYTYRTMRNYELAHQYEQATLAISPTAQVYANDTMLPLLQGKEPDGILEALEDAPIELGSWRVQLSWEAAIHRRDFASALLIARAYGDKAISRQNSLFPKESLIAIALGLDGRIIEARAHFELAIKWLEQNLRETPDDPRLQIALGEAYAGIGESTRAIESATRAMELLNVSDDAIAGRVIQIDAIVRVLIPAGEHELAISQLDDYLSARGGVWSIEGLIRSPRLDPIREYAEFSALREKYSRV